MLRTLIKKDLTAVLSTITIDRKRGKKRNPLVIVAFAILFVLIFISLGSAFFSYSLILGDVIGPDNWLYMALVGMMGLILALFGSVFSSYNTLFKPKDNALLLAMPIPTGKLLAARMVSVYLMSLLFVLIGTLPGYIYSWIERAVSPTAIVLQIISLLFLALLVTALSCVLGWLVALVAGLFPNKTATTVIASLGFLTVYYIFFFRIQTAFQNIDPEATGRGIASYAYPMYKMGLGATGDVVSFLIFAAICVAVFAVVYIIIARSFIKIVTKTEKQHTKTYVEKRAHQSSASSALLRKEFRHLLGSATYMLNCALGCVMMPALAVFVLIKSGTVRDFIGLMSADPAMGGIMKYLPLLLAAAGCFSASLNDLTAPSITLESKTLWLLKSLPVDTMEIFESKKRLHEILTIIPVVILHAALCYACGLSLKDSVMSGLMPVVFVMFISVLGLVVNLKLPNLGWTNEAAAVKRSGSVFLTMFGSWAVLIVLAAVYALLLYKTIAPELFLQILIGIFLVLTIILNMWLRKRGTRVFADL